MLVGSLVVGRAHKLVCVEEECQHRCRDSFTTTSILLSEAGLSVEPRAYRYDSFARQFVLGNRLTPPSEAGITDEPPHPPVLGLHTCRESMPTAVPPCQPLVLFCFM